MSSKKSKNIKHSESLYNLDTINKGIESQLFNIKNTIDLAVTSIKANIFINGSACISLLTFMGHFFNPSNNINTRIVNDLTTALFLFSTGVLFSLLALSVCAIAYSKPTTDFIRSGYFLSKSESSKNSTSMVSIISLYFAGILFFSLGITFTIIALKVTE